MWKYNLERFCEVIIFICNIFRLFDKSAIKQIYLSVQSAGKWNVLLILLRFPGLSNIFGSNKIILYLDVTLRSNHRDRKLQAGRNQSSSYCKHALRSKARRWPPGSRHVSGPCLIINDTEVSLEVKHPLRQPSTSEILLARSYGHGVWDFQVCTHITVQGKVSIQV